MKSKIIYFILLLTIVVSPFLFKWLIEHNEDNFSCRGKITFYKDNTQYSVQVKYVFDGGKGNVVSIGEYSELGKKPG
ncbi:Uncharacterised protein [Serratia fonticola]|uniref:Uncharacterized protein n=1 Tax=Serratia fonticola TaxID=47917 RepID=A0A448T7I4_SERFO|nr:Uncharacterised protein [Serratia fonticola]